MRKQSSSSMLRVTVCQADLSDQQVFVKMPKKKWDDDDILVEQWERVKDLGLYIRIQLGERERAKPGAERKGMTEEESGDGWWKNYASKKGFCGCPP